MYLSVCDDSLYFIPLFLLGKFLTGSLIEKCIYFTLILLSFLLNLVCNVDITFEL